jgi:hypothetical protein
MMVRHCKMQMRTPTLRIVATSTTKFLFDKSRSPNLTGGPVNCGDLPPLTGSTCLVRETGHLAPRKKGISRWPRGVFQSSR